MFKFLKAIRVRRSYLWASALLFEMLWSGWLDMKVACSGAEHPAQSDSSLPNPIGQASGRMEVDPVDSAIQVEENNPPTPSNPTAPAPPTPLTTPPTPITLVRVPSEVKPIVAQLQLLQMINDPADHIWLPHQTQDNTLQWILMLNPEKMALSNDSAYNPIQCIIIPKSWKETEYNRCFEGLTPLQRITGQAPMVVLGLCLEYGQASFKLLLLLLRILAMPRVEVHLYGQLQPDESHQAKQTLASQAYLLNGLPEDISARKTLLHIHTLNTIEYWRDILELVIQTYRDLELRGGAIIGLV
ncbi:hypothetical protein NEHOM01_1694 [Nematocida homosporus]|uniref:uncharacterized protein n=1 Tax=Nematocida homosporus TaxID=1912981 RepID=UPI00221E4F71|nr:uncharacterized protein NEHOM01_1694 [Nematocida homosporus]KAI5186774.1 hypothetical protein NEHOM01_1694 [Nematocida homosporus]